MALRSYLGGGRGSPFFHTPLRPTQPFTMAKQLLADTQLANALPAGNPLVSVTTGASHARGLAPAC